MARLTVDFTRKYGQWTPLYEVRLPFPPSFGPNRTVGPRGVRCRCDCGRVANVLLAQLVRGLSLKCKPCANGDRGREHGLSPNPLFRTWISMMGRCEDPRRAGYENYGGRGIEVCERWHDVRLFVADIEGSIGPRPTGLTLERINNDGNYEPGNVRWATRAEQNRNKRPPVRKRKLTAVGQEFIQVNAGRMARRDMAASLGVSVSTVSRALKVAGTS